MSAILKSVASLVNIFLLIVFVMVIYAIVFMTLLKSKFHYTCKNNQSMGKTKLINTLFELIETFWFNQVIYNVNNEIVLYLKGTYFREY